MLLRLVSFIHDVRLARTLGVRTEKRVDSCISEQKLMWEHVDHRKHGRGRARGFRYRKASRTIGFRTEIEFQAGISLQNTMGRRPFLYKTEVCGAMDASRPSQRRDLAKVDDFEPLSL